MSSYVAVVSPKRDVKLVKSCLEDVILINQNIKVRRLSTSADAFAIPTNVAAESEFEYNEAKDKVFRVCEQILPPDALDGLKFTTVNGPADPNSSRSNDNTLHAAVAASVGQLEEETASLERPCLKDLLSTLPMAYSLYPPMLLLPHNAFDSAVWRDFFSYLQHIEGGIELFFSQIAVKMKATHIAMNAPVPAQISPSSFPANEHNAENVLRSPSNLKPLYGDFGTVCPAFPEYSPRDTDFDRALWVSTRQNGITQIWSPGYTMFSSGNVTEKARILNLASVHDAVKKGREDGLGCTAVDLFAGIGYFAFSYAKAGVSKVICWDLNPWSVEGLRRGAAANKWQSSIFGEKSISNAQYLADEITKACRSPRKFLVFCESNTTASDRLKGMRKEVPPIRHVNCGMLPSASAVWMTAVEAVDPKLGGWIHLHESIFENAIQDRTRDIIKEVQTHFDAIRQGSNEATVTLEHIERVKSVGPRLLHLVLDINVPPRAE